MSKTIPYFKPYRQIGRTGKGEPVVKNLDTGEIFIEKDWERLVKSSKEDLKDAEIWEK